MRTLPRPALALVVFEYVELRKSPTQFADVPLAEYVVDVEAATVTEHPLVASGPTRQLRQGSPISEALRPGTYAPASR